MDYNYPTFKQEAIKMNLPANVLNLLTKSGQFVSIHTKRPVKTKKAFSNIQLEKEASFVVRIGVNYDNIKTVQEKRASGELPPENAGLKPNFRWVKFPVLMQNEKNGEFYVRCTKGANTKPKSKFLLNGIEVDKNSIAEYCLAQELKSNEAEVFDIKVSNIIEIKG